MFKMSEILRKSSKKTRHTVSALVFSLATFCTSTPLMAAPLFPRKPRSTPLSQIKSWHSLSHRYALGLGQYQQPLAIYDLAMENRKSFSYIRRSLLGAIGVGDMNLKNLTTFIKDVIKKEREEDLLLGGGIREHERELELLPPDLQKELAELGLEVKTKKDVVDLLDKYEKEYGDHRTTLPKNWWGQVEWKNPAIKNLDESPVAFKLSDLDYLKMTKVPRALKKLITELGQHWQNVHGIPADQDLLELFEYKKTTEGNYELYFLQPIHQQQTEPLSEVTPVKVVDIQYSHPSMLRPLGIMILQQTLSNVLNLIPNKVASTLIRYPINRWFKLYQLQLSSHRMAAFEGLNTAEINDPVTSMTELELSPREHSALYILREESNIINRVFRKPNLKRWRNLIDKDLRLSQRGLNWLNNRGVETELIHPWFAKGDFHGHKRIYLLNYRYLWSQRPSTAIDYRDFSSERIKRNLAEMYEFTLLFIDLPIPFANMAIQQIFNYFVSSPIKKAKLQESRLAAHLLQRQEQLGEDWEQEIRQLYALRINPFELSRTEEEELIKKRRELLGLPLN